MKNLEFYLNSTSRLKLPPEIIQELQSLTVNCTGSTRERMYWLRNGLQDYPACKLCAELLSSKNFINNGPAGYRDYCSLSCSMKDKEYTDIIQKRKETNISRYGSNSPWYFENFRKFVKERYNVDFIEPKNDV